MTIVSTISLPDQIAAKRSKLLAWAMFLSGNKDRAEDLVQETMLRALVNLSSFDPSTNLEAWLFTICRNQHISQWKKRRREVEDVDGVMAAAVPVGAEQQIGIEFAEAQRAIAAMPGNMREAFRMVVMDGQSYEDAADIAGVEIGTIKSRVNRAHAYLAERGFKSGADGDQFGTIKQMWRAGRSASEISAFTGTDIVEVMKVIATFGERRAA